MIWLSQHVNHDGKLASRHPTEQLIVKQLHTSITLIQFVPLSSYAFKWSLHVYITT